MKSPSGAQAALPRPVNEREHRGLGAAPDHGQLMSSVSISTGRRAQRAQRAGRSLRPRPRNLTPHNRHADDAVVADDRRAGMKTPYRPSSTIASARRVPPPRRQIELVGLPIRPMRDAKASAGRIDPVISRPRRNSSPTRTQAAFGSDFWRHIAAAHVLRGHEALQRSVRSAPRDSGPDPPASHRQHWGAWRISAHSASRRRRTRRSMPSDSVCGRARSGSRASAAS